jgi:hypothetical protein
MRINKRIDNNILILMTLMIMLAAVVLSGCTTTTSPSATTGASTSAATATPTVSSTGNTPSGAPSVSTSGTTSTVSGSQNGDFNVAMTKGGYLFTVQTKDSNLEFDWMGNAYLRQDPSLQSSGWYVETEVRSWTSDGQIPFSIKATGPYTVTITKLPTGTPVTPPQTYTGKGEQALGPITLKAGSASFNIKGPSMQDSGFSLQLKDGATGNIVSVIDTNSAMDASQSSYQSQKTIDIPAAGDYYIQAFTNGNDGWEVDVSQ